MYIALFGMTRLPLSLVASFPFICLPRACHEKCGGIFRASLPRSDSLQQRASPKPWPLTASARQAYRCALCGLSVNPASLIVQTTQRQAARGRAGIRPPLSRRPTGQRRITARVMRSFGRRLPHTLPFPAHPRVASRPKSPARARATLFDLPATLRAGTESVLFPWRCCW